MATRDRRGFVLVAALWLLVAVGAVMLAASLESRARRNAAANVLERTRARAAASAGVEYARSQLGAALVGRVEAALESASELGPSGRRRLATTMTAPWWTPQALVDPTRDFGGIAFDVQLRDAGALLNINVIAPDEIRRFFANGLGLDYALADRLAQAIADWRDPDGIPRVGGAERDDYLRAGATRLPTNRPFGDVDELRYVLGMPPDVFEAARPYLSTIGLMNQINVNAAPEPVLLALPGFTPAAADAIVRGRESGRVPTNMDELLALLPANVRDAPDVREQLQRRVTFLSIVVVAHVEGRVDGSPVRARQRAFIANGFMIGDRPGEAIVVMRFGE